MDFSKSAWWSRDSYDDPSPTGPLDLQDTFLWGPNGAAMVPLWDNGTTGVGWGKDTFMSHYNRNDFTPRRILYGYEKDKWNYAWVMRGSRLVCIDIDGKNGGIEYASQLGWLPETTAETSKSGNGYHLFYLTDDVWDDQLGFQTYQDQIGITTGVDFRGTGCVYHYPTQRWNNRKPARLPEHLEQKLRLRTIRRQQSISNITKTLELDKEDIALMHNDLLEELAKPVPVGRRNNTLFAIGTKMRAAEVESWDEKLEERANQLGLDSDEIDKLVSNIEKYADN